MGTDSRVTFEIELDVKGAEDADNASDAIGRLKAQTDSASASAGKFDTSTRSAVSSLNRAQNAGIRTAAVMARLSGANSAVTNTIFGIGSAMDAVFGVMSLFLALSKAVQKQEQKRAAAHAMANTAATGGAGAPVIIGATLAAGGAVASYSIPVPQAAHGAIVSQRTILEAGEREPEAIFPVRELMERRGGEVTVLLDSRPIQDALIQRSKLNYLAGRS